MLFCEFIKVIVSVFIIFDLSSTSIFLSVDISKEEISLKFLNDLIVAEDLKI